MHQFGCAEDRIYRTGLDTQGATDADPFIDKRYGFWFYLSIVGVERHGFDSEQVRQRRDAGIPARRALVDAGFASGDRFCIGPAARVVALATLGLRQDGFDLVDYRVRFDPESPSRPTKSEPEQPTKESN